MMADWRAFRRTAKWAVLTSALLATPAAASPPTVLLGIHGPEDLRVWTQPLWMEDAPAEPPMSITAHEIAEQGGALMSEEGHDHPEMIDDGRVGPKPVPKPYAPGDTVAVGLPNRGYLVSGVALEADAFTLVRPGRNVGTPETVHAIKSAIAAVQAKFPQGTHKLVVADLSREGGGRFPPHKSHQSGRDADIGYYFTDRAPERLQKVWPQNLDVPRTWTFLESMLENDQAQFIFTDHRLQRVLYAYARDEAKVPKEKLDRWFSYPAKVRTGAPIRHLKGHADHLHIRFWAPQSEANFAGYVKHHGPEILQPVPVNYRIRRGDSLARIARKHRVKIKDLKRWNRLRKNTLRPGKKLVVGFRRPSLPGTR